MSYSIGLSGEYFLHVRLRQQAMPLPGSPFLLSVEPAPAHASASRLPPGPIRGTVGVGSEQGCECVLRTADRMGNLCTKGGGKVQIRCDAEVRTKRPTLATCQRIALGGIVLRSAPDALAARACRTLTRQVDSDIVDNNDGTYVLKWRSKASGSFKTHVAIDGIDCFGSPTRVMFTSSNPEMSKSELEGPGLKHAVAGEKASFRIKFVDQCTPPDRSARGACGHAVLHAPARCRCCRPHPPEGLVASRPAWMRCRLEHGGARR